MMSFKYLKVWLFSLLAAVTLASCSLEKLPFIESAPEPERNILTGEVGSNGKVIAVKFDDTRAAHPQEGVEKADVVIITQVEAEKVTVGSEPRTWLRFLNREDKGDQS